MKGVPTRELSMAIALLAIWGFFAWAEPVFLSARNLSLLSVDGLHPNAAGFERIAQTFFTTLRGTLEVAPPTLTPFATGATAPLP